MDREQEGLLGEFGIPNILRDLEKSLETDEQAALYDELEFALSDLADEVLWEREKAYELESQVEELDLNY